MITDTIDRKEITFKSLEGANLICDFEWQKPTWEKVLVEEGGKEVIKRRKVPHIEENAKIKIDTRNRELLGKANMLVDGDIVNMYIYIPKNANYRDIEKWLIVDISDEIDLLEKSNQNCLIKCDVPEKKAIIEPKRKATKKTNKVSKKDKRIAELEEENAMLRLQLQKFQQK